MRATGLVKIVKRWGIQRHYLHVQNRACEAPIDSAQALRPATERAQVFEMLKLNLLRARAWRDRAARVFRDSTEVRGGIGSDADQVRRAADEYTLALQAAEDALKAHNDFVRHGAVPPELDVEARQH